MALLISTWIGVAKASPIVVQVEGHGYEIGTVRGFYATYLSTLQDQVWWGDAGLAQTFSNTLGRMLGTINVNGLYAPAFGYDLWDGPGADYMKVFAYRPDLSNAPDNRALALNAAAGNYWTYAVSTLLPDPPPDSSIPVPGSIWLLVVGAAGLGFSRHSRVK